MMVGTACDVIGLPVVPQLMPPRPPGTSQCAACCAGAGAGEKEEEADHGLWPEGIHIRADCLASSPVRLQITMHGFNR